MCVRPFFPWIWSHSSVCTLLWSSPGGEGPHQGAVDPQVQDSGADQHRPAGGPEHVRGQPLPLGRGQRHVCHAHLQEQLSAGHGQRLRCLL